MKILVKTDKGLRTLGEGRIYSKSQLRLVEDDASDATLGSPNNKMQVDLTGGQDADVNTIVKNSSTLKSKAAGLGGNVEGRLSIEDANWTSTPNIAPNEPGSDAAIEAPNATPQGIRDTVEKAKELRVGAITVPNENVVNSKDVIDEMRENSIPFTKKELNEFLRRL